LGPLPYLIEGSKPIEESPSSFLIPAYSSDTIARLYAPCHKSCPLCGFEIVEKSDTSVTGSIHNNNNIRVKEI
jgi:hypothetical protein